MQITGTGEYTSSHGSVLLSKEKENTVLSIFYNVGHIMEAQELFHSMAQTK